MYGPPPNCKRFEAGEGTACVNVSVNKREGDSPIRVRRPSRWLAVLLQAKTLQLQCFLLNQLGNRYRGGPCVKHKRAWTILTGYLYDTTLDDAITTTLKGNISIESLMFSNRYSRKFSEGRPPRNQSRGLPPAFTKQVRDLGYKESRNPPAVS